MATNFGKSSRITSTKLINWRNFSNVSAQLEKRAFLVGPNASGKSNFLDVFRFIRDIVALGGGIQEAISRRGSTSSIRSLSARQMSDIGIEIAIGNDDNHAQWLYMLYFNNDTKRGPIIKKEQVYKDGSLILKRPNDGDRKDPERLTQTYLQQVNSNQQFRDIANFFKSIKYLHIVPQLIREPERSVGKIHDPYGGDFLEQLASTNDKTRISRLQKIEEALRIAVPQLKNLELQRDNKGTPHLRAKYEHWRPQGAWQLENQFSDGTLRLIGLLWAVLDSTGPLLLEEPELSLHPSIIMYLPQIFARLQRSTGRQLLISTHSTVILEDHGIGLNEIILLEPGLEGTKITPVSSIKEVKDLVDGGLTIAEAVMPRTTPQNANQLSFFADK